MLWLQRLSVIPMFKQLPLLVPLHGDHFTSPSAIQSISKRFCLQTWSGVMSYKLVCFELSPSLKPDVKLLFLPVTVPDSKKSYGPDPAQSLYKIWARSVMEPGCCSLAQWADKGADLFSSLLDQWYTIFGSDSVTFSVGKVWAWGVTWLGLGSEYPGRPQD